MPAYLENLNRILPKGEFVPVPLLSSATFGPPLHLAPGETKTVFLDRARQAVCRAEAIMTLPLDVMTLPLNRELVWLFGGVLVLLVVASAIGAVLRTRTTSAAGRATVDNLVARIRAWWVMCGDLRRHAGGGPDRLARPVRPALVPGAARVHHAHADAARRSSHAVLGFFVFTPLQYGLVGVAGTGCSRSSSRSTPFCSSRRASPWRATPNGSSSARRKIHFGLMLCVFCVSHAPALLILRIPGYEGRNAKLLLFLVLVVQLNDVSAVRLGQARSAGGTIAPTVSPNKTVEGFAGGVDHGRAHRHRLVVGHARSRRSRRRACARRSRSWASSAAS